MDEKNKDREEEEEEKEEKKGRKNRKEKKWRMKKEEEGKKETGVRVATHSCLQELVSKRH